MKISLAWLGTYLDRPIDASELETLLPHLGFPVESVEDVQTANGKPDVMVDVEVTSNRSDCLSHVGVAREVAAGSGRRLTVPQVALPNSDTAAPVTSLTGVENQEPELCPVYTARVIRGAKVASSPAWLVDRLTAFGLRSVNNIVDVTNYVLLEMGQPLHAFDLDRLDGRRIIVRRARDEEPFTAIDGSRHALASNMLVIADASKPVAVAGVMGGLDSEVGDTTTDVLLESAAFSPLSVRRTSRSLKLTSDSSYRFERGVDPAGIERASRRAAALILELAGGTLAEGVIRVGPPAPEPRQIPLRLDRCRRLLGIDIAPETAASYLDRLGLAPQRSQQQPTVLTCTAPSHRLDLEREVDLIEEVARVHGLGNIPVEPQMAMQVRPKQPHVAARQQLGRVLVAHGYHETITFSFVNPRLGSLFVPADRGAVVIDDERRKAEPMLRPSILPSLLACRKSNQDAGNADVRLYETAATWQRQADGPIAEQVMLAMLCDAPDPQTALRDVRGTLEELVQSLRGEAVTVTPAEDPRFDVCGEVRLGKAMLGRFGLLSSAILKQCSLQTGIVAAELALPPLLAAYPPVRRVTDLARFPGIERDLSLILDESVRFERIEKTIEAAAPPLLECITFLVTYRGNPIPIGRKSVSFRMSFRHPDKTLRHDEVDPQVAAVIEKLKAEVGAEIRA